MIPARVNYITLGVSDLAKAGAFYSSLGWKVVGKAFEAHIRFFQLDNLVLALFPIDDLAKDAEVASDGAGFRRVTTAINVPDEAEVDRVFAAFLAAGARAVKPPVKADWGGYSSYIADPDGNLWEIAFNPFSPLDERGLLKMAE